VEPERGPLGDDFLFNALFDFFRQAGIYLVEGDAAASHVRHLRGETNEEVGEFGRILPVGQLLRSSINQGQSLELSRCFEQRFEDGKSSGWVNITFMVDFQSKRRKRIERQRKD